MIYDNRNFDAYSSDKEPISGIFTCLRRRYLYKNLTSTVVNCS